MDKIYNPKKFEEKIYDQWEKNGYFKPNGNPSKGSYCIVIPPPNITGTLHMGHAFQQTIMDILIRYQRMKGKNTLWKVGSDHAGIATQIIVERKIEIEENKIRKNYNRDFFINKIFEWKKKSLSIINNQIRRLGSSVNWETECFTMDQNFTRAVKKVFIHLYEKKLIYRGKYLVNWDTKLQTVVSDLEVLHKQSQGTMWYIKYPLEKGIFTKKNLNYLVIATTRPETLFGDTGIAINPKDLRYNNLIGKFVLVPLLNRFVPIIGDKNIDMNKGTGCVKITPAHDFKDYEIGKKYKLPMINILTTDGYILKKGEIFDYKGKKKISHSFIPKKFRGLERFFARKKLIKELNDLGFLEQEKIESIIIPYGDRSGTIIEPMLTNQWYLNIKPLTKVAIEAVRKGDIKFIPKKYENIYFNWMNNIQDWCISRQLWWGHQIPAWYDKNGVIYVGKSEKEIRKKYKLEKKIYLQQDNDVLDTWFSSSLWTFSSLGWPKNTKELRFFHPTNVLVSGFDIIFFWIARMIMLTMYFIKDEKENPQVPFKKIYITGLIKDEKGKKMSKSNGNIIDPIDIIDGISIEELLKKRTKDMIQPQLKKEIYDCTKKHFPNGIPSYGTDALRFTLASLSSNSRNINWDMNRLKGYRNFCNKLWNASRFVILQVKGKEFCFLKKDIKSNILSDRWILAKFNEIIKTFRKALDNYRFDLAAYILYEFTWNEFCDWYLESTKRILLYANKAESIRTKKTLFIVLESLLRLAHPIIPFITEAIWKKINIFFDNQYDTIMLKSFPEFNKLNEDEKSIKDFNWIKKIIIATRSIRTASNTTFNTPIDLIFFNFSLDKKKIVEENLNFIKILVNVRKISFFSVNEKKPVSFSYLIDKSELLVPMNKQINKDNELNKLNKEILNIKIKINKLLLKLNDKNFIKYAPKKIIETKNKQLNDYQQLKDKYLKKIEIFNKK